MATITTLRQQGASNPPRLLVLPKMQSPEGQQLAEVTERILLVLSKYHKYLEYSEELDYNPILPKRSERVTMHAKFTGRGKPLPYPLDEE